MKKFILYIHQLPQNLLGLIILRLHKRDRQTYSRMIDNKLISYWFVDNFFNSGISLGNYIILDSSYIGHGIVEKTIRHEHGHQIQSLRWGWLYLPVVGLISITRNIFDRLFHRNWTHVNRYNWYYGHFPEKQADRFGNVNR